MITNTQSGTNIHEIARGIYRINTPIPIANGTAFSFNQYLVLDDLPLLFHSGPRRLFPLVREAVDRVLGSERLRYVGLSHFEADECGALGEWLTVAPQAVPVCSAVAKMVSVDDVAARPAHGMQDGEMLTLGAHTLRWLDTPHVPHGWECGFMMETSTGTMLCGDLFTQPGEGRTPLTRDDILAPSEAFRLEMDYYAHAPHTRATIERLAQLQPKVLACMHGSAWEGDGGALLRELARSLESLNSGHGVRGQT